MTQEALKLALEAYKKDERHNTVAETRYWCNQYKLLAEQALVQPEQEPVAWMDADGNTFPFVWNVGVQQGSKYLDETLTPLYTYPPQRTEQDPVAWLCKPDENGLFGLPTPDKGCKDCFPVYRQRTWVGLTAEDRLTAKYMQDAPDGIEAVIDYLEAKLKQKNGYAEDKNNG